MTPNGDYNGANGEVPEDGENNILNPGGDNFVPSLTHSPRNLLISSKSIKIEGNSYQIRKQKINRLLSEIEGNSSQHHSEHLEKQAALLSTMLTKMDIKHIISIADTEPDFLEIFGETEDQKDDWRHETEAQIDDLMIRASKEVSKSKAATQSVFKKLAYPQFNGDVLNYLEFKK